ncbi:MAG: hypothetical protein LUG24_05410 [Clostridiales bacterium]|nr:hypothetical protein [Clostridiales bacterium]
MFKIDTEDFIFEVTEELSCYEEIGKKGAEGWAEGFRRWLKEKKKGVKEVSLKDESDIFEIADEYLEALEEGNTTAYWKRFSLKK